MEVGEADTLAAIVNSNQLGTSHHPWTPSRPTALMTECGIGAPNVVTMENGCAPIWRASIRTRSLEKGSPTQLRALANQALLPLLQRTQLPQ